MNYKRNKPLLLNTAELQMITNALLEWKEPDNQREEKAVLLNALKALEYIDEVDKAEEQKHIK